MTTQTIAATDPRVTSREQKMSESLEAQVLLARIDEINAMDKSELTASEKRDLRKEVRESRKHLNSLGGGVYLSVGALIIILLLLIILL